LPRTEGRAKKPNYGFGAENKYSPYVLLNTTHRSQIKEANPDLETKKVIFCCTDI
jgi:hypothetical protein